MSNPTTNGGSELTPVKRALLEIRDLKERLLASERRTSEPIAIVGMGCRFPGGVNDPSSFWELLENGRDAITEIPRSRWDVDAYFDPNPDVPGKMSTRWGGFLSDIDRFDPEFFGISAREAASLDPQQRLLLEVSWQALEDAGVDPTSLLGSETGVFAGIAAFDYAQLELQANDPAKIDAYFATGGSHSVAAGRISYVLGLKGPCMAVDTACSGSLVAVHLACQSLRSRECDLALAGGVSILLLPELFVDFSHAHMLAADGRCKTFDAAADGYSRGEGCGMVVLKRLSDAVAAGDRIAGLIRGSAINHDGRSSGLTAPNGPSQVAVVRSALDRAGLRPEDVCYVEAHGTGTSLGDPIEVQAIASALAANRTKQRPLLVGSVKSNVGHLEAAAGVAGLIKAVLCLQRGAIPKSLHFRTPNPVIAWDRLAVKVVADYTPWPAEERRVAGVSSFGFSGTNAHVVLEAFRPAEPERVQSEGTERPLHVITVSGRSAQALAANTAQTALALAADASVAAADFAFSANVGRAHFTHRAAIVGATRAELVARLERASREVEGTAAAPGDDTHTYKGVLQGTSAPAVCLVFSGQGSQYAGMGRELFATQPSFRRSLERCNAVLEPLLGKSLAAILYSADSPALLADVRFAQPAIVAVQYALSELLREWGVVAATALGHSLGEYAAAIYAGVLSLEDGLRLVVKRAALIEERCVAGGMLALRCSEADAERWVTDVGGTLAVAAVNGGESVVVSGAVADIERLAVALERGGVRRQALETTRAFHNALLDPALGDFAEFAQTVEHRRPQLQLVSNLTGELFALGAGPDAAYWAEQARHTVRFADGVRAARGARIDVFLEVSAGATLTGLVQEVCGDDAALAQRCLVSLRRGRGDWQQLSGTVAALYAAGVPIDWRAFDRDYTRRKVAVPGYAFQRGRHWYNDAGGSAARSSGLESRLAWDRAIAAAERQAAQVPIDLELRSCADRWELLDALTTEYIVRTLRELGMFRAAGERRTAAAIVQSCGVLAMYQPLIERWLQRLAAKRLLTQRDGEWLSAAPLRAPDVAPILARARATFVDAPYIVDYIDRCGAGLTAIITGKESALETLFPGGSMQTAVDLYRNWSVSRYFNAIAAALAAAIDRELPAGETLRLLEIGGGSGGTTAAVLPMLAAQRTQYQFTDVSEFFFSAAAREFADHAFVEYRVLDIEKDPEQQGFGRHAFHGVVAANVLHATADLAATIDRVLGMLRPGGVLILYEVTAPQSWLDTSVALIAGWAQSADGLRDDGPLLAAGTWQKLLRSRGFEEVAVFPAEGSAAAVLGMSVIAARAPARAEASVLPQAAGRPVAVVGPDPRTAALLAELAEALPDERLQLLVGFLRDHVTAVLRRDAAAEPIGRRHNLMDLGLDSLMAVELRNRLTQGLGLAKPLPVSLIFDYPNIEAIAEHVAGLLAPPSAPAEPVSPARAVEQSAQNIADLSDEEIEAMLLKKLDHGGTP